MDIVELFNIPLRSISNTRITKKTFLENYSINRTEKKLLKDDIHELFWVAALKPKNTNISIYKSFFQLYDEVHFIRIKLKKENHFKKISEMIQKSMPYPLVLVFIFEDIFCISTAEKRIQKNDPNKRIVEEYHYSKWIDLSIQDTIAHEFLQSLKFEKLPKLSLKDFYDGIVKRIHCHNISKVSGKFELDSDNETSKKREIVKKLQDIDEEVVKLKKYIKTETQLNKKIDMNIKIKTLEEEKKFLKDQL